MEPVYVSESWRGSMGQEYRVYPDRVELPFRLFLMTYRIPIDEISRVRVVPGGIDLFTGVFRGEQPLMSVVWVLMLDTAAFRRHVLLERKSGSLRYFRFTPVNPEGFVRACEGVAGPVT